MKIVLGIFVVLSLLILGSIGLTQFRWEKRMLNVRVETVRPPAPTAADEGHPQGGCGGW